MQKMFYLAAAIMLVTGLVTRLAARTQLNEAGKSATWRQRTRVVWKLYPYYSERGFSMLMISTQLLVLGALASLLAMFVIR